jgi:anti-sigma factor RsiW
MRSCDALDPLVTPYVDGELPDEDRRAVEAHLRACAPCHSRVTAERAVHELIRHRQPELNAVHAPEPLRAACAELARRNASPDDAAQVDDRAARRPQTSDPLPAADVARMLPPVAGRRLEPSEPRAIGPNWRARLSPYALAASLVVVVGGAFVYQATDQSAKILAAQLTADHLKCFAMNSALGTHQTASAVESSMLSSFDWNMHLPADAARNPLELIGARQCLYGEGRVAHIMYRHAGRPVSLFMLPKTARTQQLVDVLGHEAAIWCAGNRTFVLIAREPKPQVEQLASFVKAELR